MEREADHEAVKDEEEGEWRINATATATKSIRRKTTSSSSSLRAKQKINEKPMFAELKYTGLESGVESARFDPSLGDGYRYTHTREGPPFNSIQSGGHITQPTSDNTSKGSTANRAEPEGINQSQEFREIYQFPKEGLILVAALIVATFAYFFSTM